MNICVVGTGYVGLVAGTGLSDFGMNVTCVDVDRGKIDILNQGKLPIYELGLTDLIQRNVKLDRLHFSTNFEEAVDRSLVIFLAVGTPENEDGTTNLEYINEAAIHVARCMTEYKIIAIKSTVPVGTSRKLRELIQKNLTHDVEFDIVSNPEFLREGSAVEDFMRPDRVILGSDSQKALAIMRDIYRPLYLLETPIISTNNETAELIKYACNTFLALKISYINEIANMCDLLGADVYQVARAMGMDGRIGSKFLHPGPGYGGSCFPKDVSSLVQQSRSIKYDFHLAESVLKVNTRQRQMVVDKSRQLLGDFKDKNITILGLSFKPNTDDVRESPALYVADKVMREGAVVNAFDPAAMEEAKKSLEGLNYFRNSYSACENADLIIICTEWNEFRDLDFKRIKELVRIPNVYDTRNIYKPEAIKELGFNYLATGRNL